MLVSDTIAAIATPPGRGGIGIVRVSGPRADAIVEGVCGGIPAARAATLATFRDGAGQVIDQGLVLRFVAPQSYTGESGAELHGHGGPSVMRLLLARCTVGCALAERAGRLWAALADGTLPPPVIERHALDAAADAHARLQSRRTTGPLVLVA